jgi:outer membrane murein-binding lipoprotein Lpp
VSDILLLMAALLAGAIAAGAVLLPRLRQARGMVTLLESQLSGVGHERQALADELAASRDEAAVRDREIAAENAELRRRMDEIADLLMKQDERVGPGPDHPGRLAPSGSPRCRPRPRALSGRAKLEGTMDFGLKGKRALVLSSSRGLVAASPRRSRLKAPTSC